jgi:hypothetical protein
VAPTSLSRLAGRVPKRWRRRVPMRLRNLLVARLGHPGEPFDPAAYPARLNLGCGYDKRDGYLNVDLNDFHAPDLVGDVRSLPALPTGRYTEIVAQDVLEHLERDDGPVALAEWRRLAAPGGRLSLRLPDLPSLLRWLSERDDADHQRRVIHHMFGTQAYNGDFHLSGYTELLLCDELFRAGFGDVEMELRDGWLWEVEAIAGGSPLGLVWGRGFHPREVDGLRWAAESAELCICLGGEQPEALALTLALSRHPDADTSLQITGAGEEQPIELTEQPTEHQLRVELQPGATRLTLTTEGRPADDGRTLAFRARGEAAIAALA